MIVVFLYVDCSSFLVDCCLCVTAAFFVFLAAAVTAAIVVIAVIISSSIHQSWALVAGIGIVVRCAVATLGNNAIEGGSNGATEGGIVDERCGVIAERDVVAKLGVLAELWVIVTKCIVVTKLDVVAKRCGVVAEHGVVITEHEVISKLGVIVKWCSGIAAKHAPSGKALLLRLTSLHEHGVVLAKRAPSGLASCLSSVVLWLPERGVIVGP